MTFCHDSQRMLTAGCTCLYILGIGSVCIRSHPGGLKFTFLCSLQQCRAGSGFVFALLILSLFRIWVSHTTCSSEYVWVLGGDCPWPKTPWVMPGKMSSFIKCLKHVAKWGLYTRILDPTKVCLSLKMSPDYQTWFRSWLLLAVSDKCSHQFQKPMKHLFITAKNFRPQGTSGKYLCASKRRFGSGCIHCECKAESKEEDLPSA